MAREKAVVRTFKVPDNAPDGMEFVDVKRAVGKAKNVVLKILVPKVNGAGVVAVTAHLSSIMGDNQGPAFVAEAIRQAIVNSVVAQGDESDTGAIATIIPKTSKLTVVDKGAVAGQRISDFITKEGRAPSAQEYKEIYAGLSL